VEPVERILHIEYVVYAHAVSLTLQVCKTDKDCHCYHINDLLREVMVFVSVGFMNTNVLHVLQLGLRTAITETVVFICISIILFPC
jgi:hypothetical protein